MSARQRLTYFTIEDESMLAEAFAELGDDVLCIAFKVDGTEDVFVMTEDTRAALDRADVPYNLLAEEEGNRISIYHTPMSKEELSDFEDALKALALAYRAIGVACVGVNGDVNLGFDLIGDTQGKRKPYTYFTAPAGHTFIWRLFHDRDEAVDFLDKLTLSDEIALEWARSLPLASSSELASFH